MGLKTAVRVGCILFVVYILFHLTYSLINSSSTRRDNGSPSHSAESVPPKRPLFEHVDTYKKIRLEYILEHVKKAGTAEITNKPYWRWNPVAVIDSLKRYKNARLRVTPSLIENGGSVTLEWEIMPDPSQRTRNSDWIALFCPSSAPSNKFIDYWPVNELITYYPSSRGRANFVLFNVRTDCEFRYFTNDTFVELVAVSNKLNFVDGAEAPLHGHLALTGDASEMRVQWTTGVQYVPTVKYGLCGGKLDRISRGVSRTYTASDMCGPPANLSYHFVHPGYIHDVVLIGLEPNMRYCYRYGSPGFKYSPEQSFMSMIKPGSDVPFKFVAYGDMDMSLPPGSFTTAALVKKDIIENGVSMVLHVGDLSYAVGLGYRWDQWMTLIEPYSTLAPYMITMGNHEQEHIVGGEKDPSHHPGNGFHPEWGNYGHDSGGECGVPVYYRFHMPDQNGNQPWWYSYEYGLAHFTVLSTENNFTRGSWQYTWLVNDLRSVDHLRTPWLIVNLHRSMYSSEKYSSDNIAGQHIRQELEHLFHKYRVDMVIAGHYHSYERTCRVYQEHCVEDGTMHATVGSAGFVLDSANLADSLWQEHYEAEFGYGRATVVNRTALLWEYVRNKDKKVTDHVWLYH